MPLAVSAFAAVHVVQDRRIHICCKWTPLLRATNENADRPEVGCGVTAVTCRSPLLRQGSVTVDQVVPPLLLVASAEP